MRIRLEFQDGSRDAFHPHHPSFSIMDSPESAALPPLLIAFLFTLGMSFLLGLGLREYYLVNQKRIVFGTTRTCMFIGLLGFVLYRVQEGGWPYLAGMLILGLWLGFFYRYKLDHEQTGLIGLLLALISYTVGPVSLALPHWFLILYVIAVLFVLNAKEKIRLLTLTLANEEIITLAKFLVVAGVILPLTPREPLASFLPVSLHQTWLAVVVISGISYLSYLVQTYLLKGRGMLLTGAIGGLYSSTAATVVVARQSHHYSEQSTRPAAAIILATGVMYLRLLVILMIFRSDLGWSIMPALLGFAGLAMALALVIQRRDEESQENKPLADGPQNPLELNAALLFAVLFLGLTAATHFMLSHYSHRGLQWMAFFTGFTDIDPFVLALVEGDFPAASTVIGKVIFIAVASNNLLKSGYAWLLGAGRTQRLASLLLLIMAALTLMYGVWGM